MSTFQFLFSLHFWYFSIEFSLKERLTVWCSIIIGNQKTQKLSFLIQLFNTKTTKAAGMNSRKKCKFSFNTNFNFNFYSFIRNPNWRIFKEKKIFWRLQKNWTSSTMNDFKVELLSALNEINKFTVHISIPSSNLYF